MVWLTDHPDMTIDVYCGRKTTTTSTTWNYLILGLMRDLKGTVGQFELYFMDQ